MAGATLDYHQTVLRDVALGYPESHEDHPWGYPVIKVRAKVFVFLSGVTREGGGFSVTVKLPISSEMALTLPFVSPSRYGLGKSGWVTAAFEAGETPPLDMLKAWIDQRATGPLRRRSSSTRCRR